jgi:peptidoglycan/LPS O-acetylase OafA/YrhL
MNRDQPGEYFRENGSYVDQIAAWREARVHANTDSATDFHRPDYEMNSRLADRENVRDKVATYMPQLDALRAYAVLAVLVHHLLSHDVLPSLFANINLGFVGVRLFFVLSGFLITGILLRARRQVELGTTSNRSATLTFYARRTLRIFPIYYATIAVALFFGNETALVDWPWMITYTYNLHFASEGWWPAYFAHFWSLSVEEQYYFVWPWIVLFVPRNWLVPIVMAVIALAPLYRLIAFLSDFNGIAIYAYTPSSLDALGIGSLLAIVNAKLAIRERRNLTSYLMVWLAIPALLAAILLQMFYSIDIVKILHVALFELSLACVFAWLVWGAANRFGGIGALLLEAKPLIYLGRISYGIYVYHLFLPDIARPYLRMMGISFVQNSAIDFGIMAALTVLLAAVSWHFFEAAFNKLKRQFKFTSK